MQDDVAHSGIPAHPAGSKEHQKNLRTFYCLRGLGFMVLNRVGGRAGGWLGGWVAGWPSGWVGDCVGKILGHHRYHRMDNFLELDQVNTIFEALNPKP